MASKSYADRLRSRIKDVATPSTGMAAADPEKEQTTHYSTMDGSGCAVAIREHADELGLFELLFPTVASSMDGDEDSDRFDRLITAGMRNTG